MQYTAVQSSVTRHSVDNVPNVYPCLSHCSTVHRPEPTAVCLLPAFFADLALTDFPCLLPCCFLSPSQPPGPFQAQLESGPSEPTPPTPPTPPVGPPGPPGPPGPLFPRLPPPPPPPRPLPLPSQPPGPFQAQL